MQYEYLAFMHFKPKENMSAKQNQGWVLLREALSATYRETNLIEENFA